MARALRSFLAKGLARGEDAPKAESRTRGGSDYVSPVLSTLSSATLRPRSGLRKRIKPNRVKWKRILFSMPRRRAEGNFGEH